MAPRRSLAMWFCDPKTPSNPILPQTQKALAPILSFCSYFVCQPLCQQLAVQDYPHIYLIFIDWSLSTLNSSWTSLIHATKLLLSHSMLHISTFIDALDHPPGFFFPLWYGFRCHFPPSLILLSLNFGYIRAFIWPFPTCGCYA